MSHYELDKEQGPHAASGLSDEDLQYLLRITSLELAIRMSSEDYTECFRNIAEIRKEMDEMIEALRKDRDRMAFVAEVTGDLERLQLTTDEEPDEAYGLYL